MPSPVPVGSIANTCQSVSRHAHSKSLSVLPPPPSSSSISTGSGPGKKGWWQQLFVETKMTSWSKHSGLTEERVQEHNMRTTAADTSSPYYRGLTDATLILNRQKQATSPERESHMKTNTTEGSLSSFISKVHIWACLPSKGNDDDNGDANFHKQKSVAAADGVKKPVSYTLAEFGEGRMTAVVDRPVVPVITPRMNGQVDFRSEKEKPLRERVPSRTMARSPSQTLVEDGRGAVVTHSDIFESWNKVKYVWADRYRPAALKDFICNRNKASALIALANAPGCGHLIFAGPPGVGKTTMIRAFIQKATRSERLQIRETLREFDLKGESVGSIQVNVIESDHHVELNLSALRGYEKSVIVKLIKERHTKCNKSTYVGHGNCNAIVLYEADKLPSDTLLYIRWLLERFKGFSKVFFCCSDYSKLQLIKGLCSHIELLPPSNEEIVQVLKFIAKHEGIMLPDALANEMAVSSKNNLRQAIRSFEATWRHKYPFVEDQDIKNGWEDAISRIAQYIMLEQSPRRLYDIRRMLQTLIEHNVSAEYTFKTLADELRNLVDEHLKAQVEALYNDYNRDGCYMPDQEKLTPSQLQDRNKKLHDKKKKGHQFTKIEEFIARFMSMYKTSMTTKKASPSPLM